ncbi:DUF2155 domain-containing protein [Acidocella sp.]|uniref:DUF2155 domain-containing protein n=1 Tax=Acidocella sp. TaxID=50710 RepID=UPI003D054211
MRLLLLASAATCCLATGAHAQSLLGQSQPGGQAQQPAVAVPAPPPIVAAPPTPAPAPKPAPPAPPPGLVQTPLPPSGAANADNGDAAGQAAQMQAVSPSAPSATPAAGAAQPAQPDVAPVQANDWVPGKTAVLGVLNKVDGSTKNITVPVGGQVVVGDLNVSVQACVTRPPGQLPDSAVFLTLQPKDDQAAAPVYRGWMVHSTPGATDAGNAGQAFRVITCS